MLGFGRCRATVSCCELKHQSDPILDSTGGLDRSTLAEDLSSHSRGSLIPNSKVSASPLPTPLSGTFLNSLGHDTLLSVWKEIREILDVEQTKKMVPLITCDISFG